MSATGPKRAPAATLVIFGVTGDLTRRLLVPALANLRREGLIGDGLDIVGIGKHPSGSQGLADAENGPSHDRPRDRQLIGLFFANRDDVLRIGQQAAEGAKQAAKAKGYFRQIVEMCKDAGNERPELAYARKMAN